MKASFPYEEHFPHLPITWETILSHSHKSPKAILMVKAFNSFISLAKKKKTFNRQNMLTIYFLNKKVVSIFAGVFGKDTFHICRSLERLYSPTLTSIPMLYLW